MKTRSSRPTAPPGTGPSRRLETFDNPNPERDYEIRFECPEFTCLCPKTGQPDFATLRIRYVPGRKCVELKSLKLYLWSYRNEARSTRPSPTGSSTTWWGPRGPVR